MEEAVAAAAAAAYYEYGQCTINAYEDGASNPLEGMDKRDEIANVCSN